MTGALLRVCVTGPECTGKTTLAHLLAEWVGTVWVPEASRLYAERAGTLLRASDVGPIAREHIALAEAAAHDASRREARLIVLDTDLLSTVVYARHYYGSVPRWILAAEKTRRAHLYLLCDVDLPWTADGVRDRPADRADMHAAFRSALHRRRANVVDIVGDATLRCVTARDALVHLMKSTT